MKRKLFCALVLTMVFGMIYLKNPDRAISTVSDQVVYKNNEKLTMCVVFDDHSQFNHEEKNILRSALSNVLTEYKQIALVEITPTTEKIFQGQSEDFSPQQKTLRNLCGNHDLVIGFTKSPNSDPQIDPETGKEIKGFWYGLTLEKFQISVVYQVNELFKLKDNGGHPAIETIIKHELGHALGLQHGHDKNYFMYSGHKEGAVKSNGNWDDSYQPTIASFRWLRSFRANPNLF